MTPPLPNTYLVPMSQAGRANHLIQETSPYLLQHARNPVDWHPWGDEALDKARRENKLLLVSIGYSACHWCHVMERESFEDEETAVLMNRHFVCIKVDREERPDIDQVYMNAVQLISGQGGWPLNCFALPDGRPVYGGTYFRKAHWQEVLRNLADLYGKDPEKVNQYADQLTKGVRQSEWEEAAPSAGPFLPSDLVAMVQPWRAHFDHGEGGMDRAPKFPLPNNWQFLLRYARLAGDEGLMGHVRLTLDKMARGGIYDHLGGGFARYSTDALWKAPHFEKMLYDNGQLIELYAEAFRATGDPAYAKVVRETAGFVARELTSPEGGFYSALDADSEGEEGQFYVWSKEELESALGEEFPLFRDYYNVNSHGYWEEGKYILLRRQSHGESARAAGMEERELERRMEDARRVLLALREKRPRPGLDDKVLTSWNALMAKGYVAAFAALGDEDYLKAAERNLEFILAGGRREDGGLFRNYKAGRFTINAFLEDYAFTCEALIALYQATFEEKWLATVRELADYAILHFQDPASGLFHFTSDLDKPLVARKMEILDNVIPASNSAMAKVLFALSSFYGEDRYRDMAVKMLGQVREAMPAYGSGYSNWGLLFLNLALPFHEVVMAGPEAHARRRELEGHYLPNLLLAGAVSPCALPILEGRYSAGRTRLYVCQRRVCGLPADTVAEALAQMEHP